MEKEVRSEKAYTIYYLLDELNGISVVGTPYYDFVGGLNFYFRCGQTCIDCVITPVDNGSYKMKIFQQHNMYQITILNETDNIQPNDLNKTFRETATFLASEYKKYNRGSWWGYKEITRIGNSRRAV